VDGVGKFGGAVVVRKKKSNKNIYGKESYQRVDMRDGVPGSRVD
jgi:hypothetical protein